MEKHNLIQHEVFHSDTQKSLKESAKNRLISIRKLLQRNIDNLQGNKEEDVYKLLNALHHHIGTVKEASRKYALPQWKNTFDTMLTEVEYLVHNITHIPEESTDGMEELSSEESPSSTLLSDNTGVSDQNVLKETDIHSLGSNKTVKSASMPYASYKKATKLSGGEELSWKEKASKVVEKVQNDMLEFINLETYKMLPIERKKEIQRNMRQYLAYAQKMAKQEKDEGARFVQKDDFVDEHHGWYQNVFYPFLQEVKKSLGK